MSAECDNFRTQITINIPDQLATLAQINGLG